MIEETKVVALNPQIVQHAKFQVDGKSVPLTSFYLPPTNFGQPVPGRRQVTYEIELPLTVFIDAIPLASTRRLGAPTFSPW